MRMTAAAEARAAAAASATSPAVLRAMMTTTIAAVDHKVVAAVANATSPGALRAMTTTIAAVAHKGAAAAVANATMTTTGAEDHKATAGATIAAGSEIRAVTPRRHGSAGGIASAR